MRLLAFLIGLKLKSSRIDLSNSLALSKADDVNLKELIKSQAKIITIFLFFQMET